MRFYSSVLAIVLFLSGLCRGDEIAKPVIVLTFDDGPRRSVLAGDDGLLAFLKKEQIFATFFVQGWQAQENPDLIRNIIQEGHRVANHTYNHATPYEWARILARKDKRNWQKLQKEEKDAYMKKGEQVFLQDAERGRKVLISLTGSVPLFLRPPKWDISQDIYCDLSRTYIVQMIPGMVDAGRCLFQRETSAGSGTSKIIPRVDVNTTDYDIIFEYVRKSSRLPGESGAILQSSVRALMERVRIIQARHKNENCFVLVFHEHKVVTEALRILIPEWKKQGIRFMNLNEVYGL